MNAILVDIICALLIISSIVFLNDLRRPEINKIQIFNSNESLGFEVH